MDAIVQLIRNALCCVKDLNLFNSTILHDANHTAKIYNFSSPHMAQTTPLELMISITQLYACVSCSISGFKLMKDKGVLKLRKLTKIADMMEDKYKTIKSKKASGFIQQSIMNEAKAALRDTFVGICVLSIGVSFFWLFANSLHITSAGWIGGLPALIHALTVMEVALVPLLYLMLKDASQALFKASRIQSFVAQYKKPENKPQKGDDSWLTLETFTYLQDGAFEPLWTTPGSISKVKLAAEEKVLIKDIELMESKVNSLSGENATIITKEREDRLQKQTATSKLEGYREYVYFLLNFIAFYGYLLGILVYYFNEEKDQPSVVSSLKLGASNADADWFGNFAGDLMWTIEPMIILSSPLLIKYMTETSKPKEKSD